MPITRRKERYHESHLVGSHSVTGDFTAGSRDFKSLTITNRESLADSTSPKPYLDPNPLVLTRVREGCIRLSGSVTSSFLGSSVTDSFSGYPLKTLTASYGVDSLTPLSSYAAMALERATPNSVAFSSGELVQSVLELPSLARGLLDATRNALKNPAKSMADLHLLGEFALNPSVQDLKTLIGLQRSLAESARNTRRADQGKSFNGTLYKNENEFSSRHYVSTFGHLHSYDVKSSYKTRVWYSVRFRSSGGSRPPPSLERTMPDLSGASRGAATLWELIPWSFLIDYFVDFGTYLSNLQSFEVRDICVMRHCQAKVGSPQEAVTLPLGPLRILENKNLKFSAKGALAERKERAVFSSGNFVPIKFFLGAAQVTNILALVTSRAR